MKLQSFTCFDTPHHLSTFNDGSHHYANDVIPSGSRSIGFFSEEVILLEDAYLIPPGISGYRRDPRQPSGPGLFETDRSYLEGLAIRMSPRLSFWPGLTVNSLRISGPVWPRTYMV